MDDAKEVKGFIRNNNMNNMNEPNNIIRNHWISTIR